MPPCPTSILGVVFLRQGQLTRAIGQFEAGLNLPASPIPVPDLQSAAEELRRAIPPAEGPAEAYHVLGKMLGVAGAAAPQIVAAFQNAIRLRPDYAQAHNSLGLVFLQTGDDEKAIAAFREAIRLRPDFADAHQNLGAVLTASDPAEAVRELERAAVARTAPAQGAVQSRPGLRGQSCARTRSRRSNSCANCLPPRTGIRAPSSCLDACCCVRATSPRRSSICGPPSHRNRNSAKPVISSGWRSPGQAEKKKARPR